MSDRYEAPAIRPLGSVRALTEQSSNKIGPTEDVFTAVTQGAVIGSLVGFP